MKGLRGKWKNVDMGCLPPNRKRNCRQTTVPPMEATSETLKRQCWRGVCECFDVPNGYRHTTDHPLSFAIELLGEAA